MFWCIKFGSRGCDRDKFLFQDCNILEIHLNAALPKRSELQITRAHLRYPMTLHTDWEQQKTRQKISLLCFWHLLSCLGSSLNALYISLNRSQYKGKRCISKHTALAFFAAEIKRSVWNASLSSAERLQRYQSSWKVNKCKKICIDLRFWSICIICSLIIGKTSFPPRPHAILSSALSPATALLNNKKEQTFDIYNKTNSLGFLCSSTPQAFATWIQTRLHQ